MKFLNYAFYRVYYWSINISDDALNELKPGMLFGSLEALLFFDLFICFKIVFMSKAEPMPLFIFVGIPLVFFNVYLGYNKRWAKYSEEFEGYSAGKRKIWDISVISVIVGVIAFTIFSIYELTQINFSKLS